MPSAWNRPNNAMAGKKAPKEPHPSRAIKGLGHTRYQLNAPRKAAGKKGAC